MRKSSVLIVVGLLVMIGAGCGGGEDDSKPQTATAETQTTADTEDQITSVAEEWAHAFATEDGDTYCSLQLSRDESLCRNYLAGAKPSVYQTGYLNATVEEINQSSGDKAIVTLSNGCKIEMTDEGGGDWRVSNSGGELAAECEQGTGR